ncbi:winged helix-turn-helix domain-containing protein [Candidatus Bathyarchaeota archaeon]|nr:winged helix-turn-helix domain-containing protein [Candidatus Bathyarchaeota archaeon]
MVRRDRHDIVVDILTKAMGGKKKTKLMSDVGLSFAQMKQYVDRLVEKELLESTEIHHIKTTKTGVEFLKKCGECLLSPWENKNERKPKKS